MMRSLATLALMIPFVFAPAATAAPGPAQGKTSLTQTDGKKKKTAKHKKHRKHHRKSSRKKAGGVRS